MGEQEIPIGLGDFPAVRELGSGGYGKVFAVCPSARVQAKLSGRNGAHGLLRNGRLLAMKQISKAKGMSTRSENNILQEVRGSRLCLRHLCSFQTPSHLYLVTEYYSGGSLLDYIKETGKAIQGPSLVYLAAELVCGLQFIHGKGVVHRDLKLANIMVTGKGHVVIVDFGLAMYKEDTLEAKRKVGTVAYRAPEAFGFGGSVHYSEMSDWWSLGVMLLLVRTGQNPYEKLVPRPEDSEQEQLRKQEELQQGKFLETICPSWKPLRAFMQGLLRVDPKLRLGAVRGAEEIKRHNLFSSFLPTPGHWRKLQKHQLTPPVRRRNVEEVPCPSTFPPFPVETDDLQGHFAPDLFQDFSVPPTSFPSYEESGRAV